MREIKFRAWNGKCMLSWEWMCCMVNLREVLEGKDGYFLMQFTGLIDRLGKEIWEGDIIAIYPSRDKKHYGKKSVFVIEADMTPWGFGFDWRHLSGYPCSTHIMKDDPINYEVLGDIYSNPELLEAE